MKRRNGFTLIEILVTVTIIIILVGIAIAVGTQVKGSAAQRSTKVTLKLLEGIMRDYIAAGNPEPQPLAMAAWEARYGDGSSHPWPTPNFAETKDVGPPVIQPNADICNWVKAFRADPAFAKKVAGLPQSMDVTTNAVTYPPEATILDSFGNPIRYVPYNATTRKEGYFESAGPDGLFATEDPAKVSPAPVGTLPSDDLFSTDP